MIMEGHYYNGRCKILKRGLCRWGKWAMPFYSNFAPAAVSRHAFLFEILHLGYT